MGQGIIHVLHVHHVILLIPDAVLPGKQVREELGEPQTQRQNHHGGCVGVCCLAPSVCANTGKVALIRELSRWSADLSCPSFQYSRVYRHVLIFRHSIFLFNV